MVYTSVKNIRSPLRYPGGKGSLYPYFAKLIEVNGLTGGKYIEPFAGGAGLALALLYSGTVSEIMLNDADFHIYCFWDSILNDNKQFIKKVRDTEITMHEWYKQKEIYDNPQKFSRFEVGFSTFYLNRTNRSGILVSAGPIGGYNQSGKWKLDARFNKSTLINIISIIGSLSNRISIYNLDAIQFLEKVLPNSYDLKHTLVYFDPPYVSAGQRLYLNLYAPDDHKNLAEYIQRHKNLKWVITYDDNSLIKELYSQCQQSQLQLGYSLQTKQKGTELLIVPKSLILPDEKSCNSKRWNFTNIKEGM